MLAFVKKTIFEEIKIFCKEFKDSKDRKYFLFVDNRNKLIGLFAIITIFTGLLGYCLSPKSTGLEIINNTISLFVFNWADDDSRILDIAKLFALFTVFTGIVSLYFGKTINAWNIKKAQKENYTLLIGLGEQNSSFLASYSVKNNYSKLIIIESNSVNPNVDYFKKQGCAVIVDKAKNVLKNLDLNMMKNTIISTGNDRQNIAISLNLIDLCKAQNDKKIFTRIENNNMKNLFNQNILESNEKVEIHAYSLYENMVKELFNHHTILGLQKNIITKNESYNIVLVGTSELAIELIYYLSILSNLPEENILNLYLLDPEAKTFYKKVKKIFTQIENIPHLNIIPLEIDADTLDFYKDKVWNKRNLTNIFIATEDENKNIDIAMTLQNVSYLKKIVKNTFRTKVFFAVYNNLDIRDKIDEDEKQFSNFYTFGDIKLASNVKNLIDEELDTLAKLIHSEYLGKETPEMKKLNEIWLEKGTMTSHKRDSNRAQAYHIDTKLIALGLKKVLSTKIPSELLTINTEKFNMFSKNEKEEIGFPKKFDTLLKKLARSEHNRWNAFHYLKGWEYEKAWENKIDSDSAKKHACLRPFSEFDTKNSKETYKYDLSAIINIPNYLALSKYELIEL